jgi:hypothetical protein
VRLIDHHSPGRGKGTMPGFSWSIASPWALSRAEVARACAAISRACAASSVGAVS